MDQAILFVLWLVFIALTLTLLMKVDWKDWGLVGLLLLSAGVTSLLTRSSLSRFGIPEFQQELLWLWRSFALIGGSVVLMGLMTEFVRSPPLFWQSVRRVVVGAIAIAVVLIFIYSYNAAR